MKILTIKLTLLILTGVAFGKTSSTNEISVPSAAQVADWVRFSKTTQLQKEAEDDDFFSTIGEPIWVYNYSADGETLYSYQIGLYKPGTLFPKDLTRNGESMEKNIEDGANKLKKLAEQYPDEDLPESSIKIEKRPDGRKVYFTGLMFGPGGELVGGFTRLEKFDLILTQSINYEDDLPKAQKLIGPAKPESDMSYIFRKLEEHIISEIQLTSG